MPREFAPYRTGEDRVRMWINTRVSRGMALRLDQWRERQKPIPSRGEAIRMFIERGIGGQEGGNAQETR